jgi:pSer/pThr/pTyr-binding forkhead associated (FHA) protein
MPRLVVSIDGVVTKEVQITKDRFAIGRRPYNDLVIDNLAVSGEHAQIRLSGGRCTLEDLGSTNGTYVNGKHIRSHVLANDETIEIGKYKVKFLEAGGNVPIQHVDSAHTHETPSQPYDHQTTQPPADPQAARPPVDHPATQPYVARVRLLNGANANREMTLTKIVTTLGKPGVAVASITRKADSWIIAHVEGDAPATVNGVSVRDAPIRLKSRDRIELSGIELEFFDH